MNKPILGFRKWRVDLDRLQLEPLIWQFSEWNPGVNKAIPCHLDHAAGIVPRSGCHCGFNAWFNLEDVFQNYLAFPLPCIPGAIAGAGQVEIHEEGFRSSEAQILALLLTTDKTRQEQDLSRLAEKYSVPVLRRQEFLEYLETIDLIRFEGGSLSNL